MGVCNKIMHLHDSKNTLIQGAVGTYLNEFPPMNWRCNGWRHAWTRRSEDHELSRRSGQRLEESLQPSRHVTLERIKRQHTMMWYLLASSKVKVHYIHGGMLLRIPRTSWEVWPGTRKKPPSQSPFHTGNNQTRIWCDSLLLQGQRLMFTLCETPLRSPRTSWDFWPGTWRKPSAQSPCHTGKNKQNRSWCDHKVKG